MKALNPSFYYRYSFKKLIFCVGLIVLFVMNEITSQDAFLNNFKVLSLNSSILESFTALRYYNSDIYVSVLKVG
jgi:hypothetical protein